MCNCIIFFFFNPEKFSAITSSNLRFLHSLHSFLLVTCSPNSQLSFHIFSFCMLPWGTPQSQRQILIHSLSLLLTQGLSQVLRYFKISKSIFFSAKISEIISFSYLPVFILFTSIFVFYVSMFLVDKYFFISGSAVKLFLSKWPDIKYVSFCRPHGPSCNNIDLTLAL